MQSDPSSKERILARLRFIRRDLDEVLTRLSDDMLKWAPGEGVRPIDDQLLEIAMNEVMAIALLRDGKHLSHAEAEATLVHSSTVETFKKMLADVRQSTRDYIESLSEERLAEAVVADNPWYASFGLREVPRYDALTSIALHEHYHVGQLITSLWVKGDDPYAW
ncbi:MAG TPA: DinB family protein [Fimbriimonas sp.]|nr:DinB family protein [Fimbriimonas sp.]